MDGWMAVPEHPSLLLPGEGSKHHLVSLPGCRSPRSSLQNGSVSLPDLLLLCLLLLLLPSPALPEQWRAVTRRGTPDPCWVLEEHQWGMPMGVPALPAPWLPAAAAMGGGGSPAEFPRVSQGWKWLQESEVFFCPRSPCLHQGVLPGSDPRPGCFHWLHPSSFLPMPACRWRGPAAGTEPPCCRGSGSQRQPVA